MATRKSTPATATPELTKISERLNDITQMIYSAHVVLGTGDETNAQNVCEVTADAIATQYQALVHLADELEQVVDSTKAAPSEPETKSDDGAAASVVGELSNLSTKLVEAMCALKHAAGNSSVNLPDVCFVVADVLQVRIDELDAVVEQMGVTQ